MNRIALGLLIVVACASPAVGGGFYVSGHAGQSQLSDVEVGLPDDLDATGWKVLAGWEIIRFVSVEGGYADFGDLEDDGGSSQTTQADLGAWLVQGKARLPIFPFFEIYALAGLASVDFEGTSTIQGPNPPTFSEDDSSVEPVYGLGLGFNLGRHIKFRLESEAFDTEVADRSLLTTLGVQFTF